MHDPGIPTHEAAGRAIPPTYGWFVQQGRVVRLVSIRGKVWNLESVSILQGSFGWDTEGVTKLPRPRVTSADGTVIVDGDRVVIDFPDGNSQKPLVRGGVRSIKADTYLGYNHNSEGANANRLKVRLQPRDAYGKIAGRVDLEAGVNDLGRVHLRLTDGLSFEVRRNLDAPYNPTMPMVLFQVTNDGIEISSWGGAGLQQMIRGYAFLAALQTALTEIAAGLALIPSSNAAVTALIAQINASLTPSTTGQPGQGPFLSLILRSE